ncbi:hypothetical protein B0T21DRAFT_356451 [Apiosordaria backusii]|uniref:Uncharacterized protein n=1 Tax=Apiosordaria backusii TaxID=314023 RepID=A0AA40EZQ3_9PEZI|nr:hypothetical protein B0T21DRAFT_356451 [Apiosordaria backusii]
MGGTDDRLMTLQSKQALCAKKGSGSDERARAFAGRPPKNGRIPQLPVRAAPEPHPCQEADHRNREEGRRESCYEPEDDPGR